MSHDLITWFSRGIHRLHLSSVSWSKGLSGISSAGFYCALKCMQLHGFTHIVLSSPQFTSGTLFSLVHNQASVNAPVSCLRYCDHVGASSLSLNWSLLHCSLSRVFDCGPPLMCEEWQCCLHLLWCSPSVWFAECVHSPQGPGNRRAGVKHDAFVRTEMAASHVNPCFPCVRVCKIARALFWGSMLKMWNESLNISTYCLVCSADPLTHGL